MQKNDEDRDRRPLIPFHLGKKIVMTRVGPNGKRRIRIPNEKN